ncbi:hypothetical protein F5X97DRAFT_311720 [Nemania serpens]|nr:hypothetical protein F5X97DRAFT_311720 [Nemania serpens]
MAELSTECETHVLRDPASLKQASKQPIDSSQHNDIISPTDREWREHAGEVRRRNDRSVRAEPPPPQPAQARTTNSTKPNQGRKKQTSGFGDGDDSDSDHNSSQRGIRERGEGVTMRKKKQPSLAPNSEPRARSRNDVAGPSTSMWLSPEEEQRVQLQRQIARQRETGEGGWQRLLRARRVNRNNALRDKGRMGDMVWRNPEIRRRLFDGPTAISQERFSYMQHMSTLQELLMRHYLDEALCHGITDIDATEDKNRLPEGTSRLDLLEETIKQAEIRFIVWWAQYVSPGIKIELRAIVQELRTMSAERYATATRLKEAGHGLDRCALWYERRIFDCLGMGGVPDIIDMLAKSRQRTDSGEHLNPEYIDWLCRGAPPDLIDSWCQQTLQQIRGSEIREMAHPTTLATTIHQLSNDGTVLPTFARDMGGPISMAQEFCQDDYDGKLSLVLLKGGMLVSTKPVSQLDQILLGWRRMLYMRPQAHKGLSDGVRRNIWQSDLQSSTRHWKLYRYKFDSDLGCAFKIGLDGNLLGLWTPQGDRSISQIESLAHEIASANA